MKTKSLSFVVTVWMAAAIAVSMAAYAVYQFFTMPGMTVKEIFLHHVWHVLALGVVTYVLCWLVFDRTLLRPLNRIYVHLYAIGGGKLETLELKSNVTEIRTIVDGINLMHSRMVKGVNSQALDDAQRRVSEIKSTLRLLSTLDPERLESALVQLAEVEGSLLAIVQNQRPEETITEPDEAALQRLLNTNRTVAAQTIPTQLRKSKYENAR